MIRKMVRAKGMVWPKGARKRAASQTGGVGGKRVEWARKENGSCNDGDSVGLGESHNIWGAGLETSRRVCVRTQVRQFAPRCLGLA